QVRDFESPGVPQNGGLGGEFIPSFSNASTPSDHWYFPSIAEYTTRLEQHGFDVTYAVLFDRPTPLTGEDGLANWLQMFASRFLEKLSDEARLQVIQSVEQELRPILYKTDHWTADYRRLRIIAVKRGTL
ncbi:hypothetical protein ACKFKF_34575, partial [Phormidesmis sp. 146-12]